MAPLIGLILLLGQRGTVFAGQTLTASYSWLPEIGINLSLRLDGLGFLFALLILGIGLLVILYARYYLSEQEPMGRFFAFLLLFMGSMLGVVLAENLLLMMLFWELTSLSSFLLIGFWGSRSDARKGARMADRYRRAAWRCWPGCCCSATSPAASNSPRSSRLAS